MSSSTNDHPTTTCGNVPQLREDFEKLSAPINNGFQMTVRLTGGFRCTKKKVTSECAEIAASDDVLKSNDKYGCPSTNAPGWRLP